MFFLLVLRFCVCRILDLYHVLMYVCRLYWFLLPRIFLLVMNPYICRHYIPKWNNMFVGFAQSMVNILTASWQWWQQQRLWRQRQRWQWRCFHALRSRWLTLLDFFHRRYNRGRWLAFRGGGCLWWHFVLCCFSHGRLFVLVWIWAIFFDRGKIK